MSYDRSASLKDYLKKRALRIYPAYFTVVTVCALAGVLLTSLSLRDYVHGGVLPYLVDNLSFLNFLHPTLPGVFDTNPIPIINGALWTIKVEAMFYLAVPGIYMLFQHLPKIPVIAFLYGFGLAFRALCHATGHYSLEVQLPGQLQFFMGGALLYFYQQDYLRWSNRLLIPAILLAALELYFGVSILFPLCLSVIVIHVALCMPAFNRFRPKWDLSYGFYIWHFPVLQLGTLWGWFVNPVFGLCASGAFTAGMACLSWLVVERRFLKSRIPVAGVKPHSVVLKTQAQTTSERTV